MSDIFFSDCSSFRDNFESLWSKLSQKVTACNPSDGTQISHFISSLDRQQQIILLLGGFSLPFEGVTFTMINMFIYSAVGKIHRLRKEMLHKLEAWGQVNTYICFCLSLTPCIFRIPIFSVTSSYYFSHYWIVNKHVLV